MQTRKKPQGAQAIPITDSKELAMKANMLITAKVKNCLCSCKTGTRKLIQVGNAQVSVEICDSCGGKK